MKNKRFHLLVYVSLIWIISIISSCSEIEYTAQPVVTSTKSTPFPSSIPTRKSKATVSPLPLPIPTNTPTEAPTATPKPTNTSTATPTPLGGGSGVLVFQGGYLVDVKSGLSSSILKSHDAQIGVANPLSRDGKRYGYLIDINGVLNTCVVDIPGRQRFCLEKGGGDLALSPDGMKVAIPDWDPKDSCRNDPSIKVMDIEEGNEFFLACGDRPEWSPDGSKIVFSSSRYGSSAIFVINLDGTDEKRLASIRNNQDPIWSPDGEKIAFTRWVEPKKKGLYMMNADGSEQISLTPGMQIFGNRSMKWSPDGKYIAFQVWVEFDYSGYKVNLFMVEVQTKTIIQITYGGESDHFAWSPDSSMIFLSNITNDLSTDECGNTFYSANIMQPVQFKGPICDGKIIGWAMDE